MPDIILISAMSSDRVIGTKDGMPWNVPEEYRQYLNFIRGQSVIMGRRTYEIFGNDLTSKRVWVLSRSLKPDNSYLLANSLEQAVQEAKQYEEEIFVAGGASIYQQALSIADKMYISIIKGNYEGIAYFPDFDSSAWEITEQREAEAFTFIKYERLSSD